MTVSDAPSIEGQENPRKMEWNKLAGMLGRKMDDDRMALRQVVMLSKLYFVPEKIGLHTPTLWLKNEHGRYFMPGKDAGGDDPYSKILGPYEPNRLVCDNAFYRHEWWQNAAFWWEATRALGLRRDERHLNDLVEKKHTFWCRGNQRDIFAAVQLDDALAEQVNKVGIENGAVAPWAVDQTSLVKNERWGHWEHKLIEPKPYKAKSGDWLCSDRAKSHGFYFPHEFPYNAARVFPQAFFDERARYIDELH